MKRLFRNAVIALLAAAPVIAFAQKKELSNRAIWVEGKFSPRFVSGVRSMNDGEHYTSFARKNQTTYIVKYNFKTGAAVDTLVRSTDLKSADGNPFMLGNYSFNAQENKILIATEEESIYRYSSKANYYIYTPATKKSVPLTDFSKGKQQLATFSPDSRKVAFVRNNNLFVADLATGQETAITTDGEWNKIINGAVDWVYEEEFSFDQGFYWSPDGSKIAFYRFDESAVPEYHLTIYDSLYPTLYSYKYPKAGETNSTVYVRIYDLNSAKTFEVDVNAENDQYIPRLKWMPNEKLCIMRMNRHQNHLEFLAAALPADQKNQTIQPEVFYTETSKTYIDINDNLIFLKDGKHFVWNSEKTGYNHIYLYENDGDLVGPITSGNWEVVEFFGVDEKSQRVLFSAAKENPISLGIYATSYSPVVRNAQKYAGNEEKISGFNNESSLIKLTDNTGTNLATWSTGFKYFINYFSDASTPYIITLRDNKGKLLRTLEDNQQLKNTLAEYQLSPVEFRSFTTSEGVTLNYSMIRPADFDSTKTYPMMLMIYGGPGSNTVTNAWGGSTKMWHQMLAQEGYIIVSVDPRGTMRRGRDFKHSTYLQLGKLETIDFIESAKHFGSLPYIDKNRMGIQGWSYGGYMASLAMTKGNGIFRLGIAVAPVTNWRFYDSIYTERFLRTPQENPEGYDENSPIYFADQLQGKYLIIHGTADDNVHFQNTVEMVDALIAADKHFDLSIYPDRNHGIYGGNATNHIYTTMYNYIKTNL